VAHYQHWMYVVPLSIAAERTRPGPVTEERSRSLHRLQTQAASGTIIPCLPPARRRPHPEKNHHCAARAKIERGPGKPPSTSLSVRRSKQRASVHGRSKRRARIAQVPAFSFHGAFDSYQGPSWWWWWGGGYVFLATLL
jgi:hypothetical protein